MHVQAAEPPIYHASRGRGKSSIRETKLPPMAITLFVVPTFASIHEIARHDVNFPSTVPSEILAFSEHKFVPNSGGGMSVTCKLGSPCRTNTHPKLHRRREEQDIVEYDEAERIQEQDEGSMCAY